MRATVKWLDGRAFVGETDSGHALVMDGPPDHGGRNIGPRPMEMLLLGMGGCTCFDVLDILEKSREQVDDCVIEIDAERASEAPKVFTRIHLRYKVSGQNLNPSKVERAVTLSKDKYCSASIMLGQTATISHDIEITDTTKS